MNLAWSMQYTDYKNHLYDDEIKLMVKNNNNNSIYMILTLIHENIYVYY